MGGERRGHHITALIRQDASPILVREALSDGSQSMRSFVDLLEATVEEGLPESKVCQRFLDLKDNGKTALISKSLKGADSSIIVIQMVDGRKRFVAVVLDHQYHITMSTDDEELRLLEISNSLHKVEHAVEQIDSIFSDKKLRMMSEDRFHRLMMGGNPPIQIVCMDTEEMVQRRK